MKPLQLMNRISAYFLVGVNAFCALNAAPVHDAAKDGDLVAVKSALEDGADVNLSNEEWPKGNPLHYATTTEVATHLIDNGADVNAKDKVGASPLHYANKDVARVLIANGADVNAKTKEGATPLHFASAGGKLNAVELLIDNGADLNAADEFGATPMHDAAAWSKPEAVELLIQKGADVNVKNTWGETPLHSAIPQQRAISQEKIQVVAILLKNGSDVNSAGESAKSPMSLAISTGSKELVEMLIDAGVELDSKDYFHLHHAVSTGNQEIVLTLIEAGADVNRKTPGGDPPLNSTHHFLHFDMEMFDLLLSKGAIVDVGVVWMAYFSSGVAMNLSYDYLKSIFQKMDDINEKMPAGGIYPGATLLDIVASDEYDNELAEFIRELGGEYSSIIWASKAGDISAVQEFLDSGADVNLKSNEGRTALDYADADTTGVLKKHGAKSGAVYSLLVASMLGNVTAVKTHLAAGADVEMKNDLQETSLHLAAMWGRLEVAKLLIDAGANINARNEWGHTPLDRVNHPELFEYLLKHGAKTHEWFKAGESIYIAAKVGHVEAVKQHITDGVDIDKKDDLSNETPLFLATEGGHLEVVKLLIDTGAKIDTRDEWSGRTALHLAAEKGHEDIIKFLIAEGADIKLSRNGGNSLLHDVAGHGLLAVVRILIDRGLNVNASLNSGDKVLQYAVTGGHVDVVHLLIAEGADVTVKNEWGNTFLHSAADRGHKEVVESLLSNGVGVNSAKKDGRTPLFSAILGYHEKPEDRLAIVEMLIAHGADVNVMTTFDDMPLDRAMHRNDTEIVEVLRRHGAMKKEEIKNGLLSIRNGQVFLYGHVGLKYTVEFSTDLKKWKPKRTFTLNSSPQPFADGDITKRSKRFYRMRSNSGD